MKKRVLSVVLVVVCLALAVGCAGGDPESAIVGSWECRDTTIPHTWVCNLTFDANGRFVDGDGDWGSYTISGNRITFEFDDFHPFTATFRISGDRLRLTGDDLRLTLHRV